MNSRTRLLLSIGLPVLLIIIVVVGYVLQQRAAANPPQTSVPAPSATPWKGPITTMKLALDWTPNTNHTGIYVAIQKGWYRDEGIDLQIVPYSDSVTPDVLVSSGKVDVGISSTEGIVADAAVGQPVVSIAAIIQHNTSALVALASSGITSPKQFDGKVYGGFGAPYEQAVVSAIIKKAGGKGVFKNVTLSIDTMQALELHRIDFAWVFEGWEVIQAQRQGYKLNVFPITSFGIPDYYTPNIITSPQEIQDKPDLLHRFMAATVKGYEYAQAHPDDAAGLLLSAVPAGTFPDPGLVQASQEFLSPRYAGPGHKWGWQDASAWEGYPNFMLKAGAIQDASGKPLTSMDFSKLYTNEFLQP
jgi:ABC-type nitrate/sulfonate/bicarbonate transport system substrate-binding protein